MKLRSAILTSTAVITVLGAGFGITAYAESSADQSQIQSVIQSAFDSDMKISVVPDASFNALINSATSDSAVKSVTDALYADQTNIYTGQALAQKHSAAGVMISNIKSGNARGIDGGVKKITYSQLDVNGTQATAVGIADVWSKFESRQSLYGSWHTFTPDNKVVFNIGLTKGSSGKWLISSESIDFVPGFGP